MTLQEQLTSVQAAIAAIEAGAVEYYIGSSRVRKAELPQLYAREKDLLSRISAEEIASSNSGTGAGGTRAYVQFG